MDVNENEDEKRWMSTADENLQIDSFKMESRMIMTERVMFLSNPSHRHVLMSSTYYALLDYVISELTHA